ncbi:MAG: type II secretion system minor pseudopilin GspI [Croceibacterium sp.]
MTVHHAGQNGFTLIEALVALAILGIATAGILRAVEAHIDRIGNLEQRAAAQWVAENALAEASLGARDTGERAMLGWRWTASTQLAPSDDPDLALATVTVRQSGARQPLVTLRGFVDKGTVTR